MTIKGQSVPAKPSTETLLRLSVLVFWLTMSLQVFVSPMPDASGNTPDISIFDISRAAIQYLGFGLAFWFNTRNIAVQSLARMPVLLLVFQVLCGFTLHTDLLYIVAAEIPLVLPGRIAVIWIISQTTLLAIWIFIIDMLGGPLSLMNLPQVPHIVAILLTDVSVFAIHAFAFFMGYLAASEIRGRKAAERLNAELLATQELLAQSSRMAERSFVARELHDVLGHHLVALKVNLELAQHLVPDAAKTPLGDALKLVGELLSDVRAVVGRVRGQPKIDLRQALQTLLAGVSELKVSLEFPEDLEISDPVHAHALFRCVQEAVTNTLKHAQAKRLWLRFSHDEEGIKLEIHDDGKGTAEVIAFNGLAGMKERLELVGGSLAIATTVGQGFSLTAKIPANLGKRHD